MLAVRNNYARDVRGTQPNSFALIAKPVGKFSTTKQLAEKRLREEQEADAADLEKKNRWNDIKNDWVKTTDKKIHANMVKQRFESLRRQDEAEIEARREKLRQLLEREEEEQRQEMQQRAPTVTNRQSELRERARQLREKREAERLAFVQIKLEQQFREGCEELRSTASQIHTKEVAMERLDQVKMKEELEKMQKQEDEAYAQLWKADMEAKARREEEEFRRQKSANHETVAFLQQQIATLERRREQEKQLVQEEAQLRKEQEELSRLEREKEEEMKRQKQKLTKEMYVESIRQRRAQEAREREEEAAFDMKLLEQLLQHTTSETSNEFEKKKAASEEERRYREYQRLLKEEEKERELEIDRVCNEEVEKNWQKRLGQWRQERLARKKLFDEVIKSRQEQIEEKLQANLLRREEAKKERELLLQSIANNRRIDQETKDRLHSINAKHQRDLLSQIAYNKRQSEVLGVEEQRTWAVQREAEAEYQRKLDFYRDRVDVNRVHPMRRRLNLRPSPSAHF